MKSNRQPAIRFPEFNEDWEQYKLKEIVERITRKNKNLESTLPLTISAQEGLISQSDFFTKIVASRNIGNYYLIKKGEFAYNKSYSNGYPWGAIKKLEHYDMGVLSTLYIVFKPKGINSDFLAKYYDTTYWYREVSRYAAEGARNHGLLNISTSDFFETELVIPCSCEEQQSIGSFFKQLEDTISYYERELELLKQTKQVFLQKMFPTEDETAPKIRFPSFYKKWKKCKLVEFVDTITKGTTPLDKNSNGIINYIKVENINSSGRISITTKITEKEHMGYLKRSQLKENDILFSIAGTLGRTAVVSKEILPANTNQALAIIRLKEGNIDFVETSLKTHVINQYIRKNPTIGAQPNLSLAQVKDMVVSMPSLEEQIQIGNFFKKLDESISIQEQEIELLKQTKKAFLQKMFI